MTTTMTPEERNAAFAAASNEEKRVMIAQEVLSMLDNNKIRALAGTYFDLRGSDRKFTDNIEKDMRDILPAIDNCCVCAIGASCLALIKLEDNYPVRKFFDFSNGVRNFTPNDGEMRRRLGVYFTKQELVEMEDVFEQRDRFEDTDEGTPIYQVDDEDRMRLIMQNIIDNKGFAPPDTWEGYTYDDDESEEDEDTEEEDTDEEEGEPIIEDPKGAQ